MTPVLAMWVPSGAELVVIAVVATLIFGPKQIPKLGRSVGQTVRELKRVVSGDFGDDDEDKKEPPFQPPVTKVE